jgi:ferredoxin
VLLGVGLLLTAFLARPVLGYVYPPAILNRELHDLVFGFFDRAEQGRFGFWVGGLSWMSPIVVGIVLIEVTLSRRWWCRYICPGGALYSLLGWRRPVRVELNTNACTKCTDCIPVCPVGLNPMLNRMGADCDNCGLCISHCNDNALDYRVSVRGRKSLLPIVLGVLLAASPAAAHHILGIPHYAYDDQYPQTPVLTYRVDSGPFEIKMTGYPGQPKPGERCSVYVYIRYLADGTLFDGPVTCTVMRKRWFGADPIVYGPNAAALEQSVFKFYPQFDAEAEYRLRVEFKAEDVPWTIELPMVVGEPGSPWLVVGGSAAGVFVFLVVIRAVRIKRARAGGTRDVQASDEHANDEFIERTHRPPSAISIRPASLHPSSLAGSPVRPSNGSGA